MSPEGMLVLLETLMATKSQLEKQVEEMTDAIDILVAEMKQAGILTSASAP